jgi:isoleucyl-tRNA synthetase
MEYVALATADATYIVAATLASAVIAACNLTDAHEIARFPGTALDRTTFQHPFLDRSILGTNATYVTNDTGTGAVHTAPAHGVDDFATGKRYDLPEVQYVDNAGRQIGTERFGGGVPQPYEGLTVFKSNPVIIELLKEKGALLAVSNMEHSYPHCWRCHKPVITRATEQWFIKMDTETTAPDGTSTTFRQRAIDEIKTVTWDPAWGQERITNMVLTRPDWCISRQKMWGVPIAVFLCSKCGEPLRSPEINKSIVALFMRESADAWFIRTPEEILPAGTACVCGHTQFRKEMDMLDVWFDAGSSSHAVIDFDPDVQQAPGDPDPRADLYAEGGDQHRGWFMSSLLCSIGMHNRAPFKSVATFGWTLDEKGRALSKSLGNFIDPVAIMDTLGGDIVRLWVASVDFREDVVASLPLLKRLAEEIYRKLRNTFRFLLGSLREVDPSTSQPHDFDPTTDSIAFDAMQPIDQYILARTAELTGKITKAYEEFEFHRVYHLLNEFLNSELSAFYLDVLKDRLYTYPIKFKPGNAEQQALYLARRSAQTAIYKITDALARLTAPILSFTADEVYQSLPHTHGSVHLTLFPTPESLADLQSDKIKTLLAEWDLLLFVRPEVLRQLEASRRGGQIGKALEANIRVTAGGEIARALRRHESDLAELFGVSRCVLEDARHSDLDEALESHLSSGSADLRGIALSDSSPFAITVSVLVEVSADQKCERCWRHVPDVSQQEKYPTVCLRCAEALDAIDFPPYATNV